MLIQTTNNNSTTNKSIDFNIKLSNTLTTNLMENDSDIQINNQEESGGHEYLFVLPFIVLFGLCGNIISLVAIFHSRLRKMPANQYLIVLTIADSVFLIGIIMVLFKVDYTDFLPCVLVEYVLMTSSYVSSWSIAALTLERYLAIAHPLKHVQYGHISRWKTMCCWLPLPFLLNLVQFFSLSPPDDENRIVRKCEVKNGELQMIAEFLDVFLCYCLPCCIVVTLNLIIASKVRSADRSFVNSSPPPPQSSFRRKTFTQRPASVSSFSTTKKKRSLTYSSAKSSIGSATTTPTFRKSSLTQRISVPLGRSVVKLGGSLASSASSAGTRILLVVPVVYILLNTPFYLLRLVDTIALNLFHSDAFQSSSGSLASNPMLASLYNFAHYLYYVNFSCDVIVYAFSSANFRRTVLIAWKRILCPGWINNSNLNNNYLNNKNNNSTTINLSMKSKLLPQTHLMLIQGRGGKGSGGEGGGKQQQQIIKSNNKRIK
ncbi:G_PROTEIN_RECEP_F1_2 domain-containing protein [Meloidogyne graminicola]|uniref:G_PROTEIN_RECEP_F1_2 domain-containing protein n=2 Tax=Meloidogyne graminicola TaxID=189291 RepID=A0A8S9Z8H4_9BILA|nr:G_PROTEIN_RECEP_F1_2 domain-containing protein [Meloidogyne graminicola]